MDKQQTEEIRYKIQEEITKTEKAIEDLREQTKPIAPENAIGRLSRMDAINNKSVAEAALRQAEEKLRKLKHMVTQLGKENFGKCARCGQNIPIGRLMFRPESSYCVRCAR